MYVYSNKMHISCEDAINSMYEFLVDSNKHSRFLKWLWKSTL